MAQPPKKRANEPEPRPIIVKKIIVEGHGGHHGGAWKVAYADFVTAMMAFFLLMWLLGATTERQRKSLADFFTPTLVELKQQSAGSNGMFGGDSLMAKDNYPTTGGQGNRSITLPRDASGTKEEGGKGRKSQDRQRFEELKKQLQERMSRDKRLARMRKNVRMTETREGLRIDLIDEADFAMFGMATDNLLPAARTLVAEVAKVVQGVPNDVIVRGHTDALPYAAGRSMNNWLLSSARAEATRRELAANGVSGSRFLRIEGVADREPFAKDQYDPRNRRMSVILAWSSGTEGRTSIADLKPETPPVTLARDDYKSQLNATQRQQRVQDMGHAALPKGAVLWTPGGEGKKAEGEGAKGH